MPDVLPSLFGVTRSNCDFTQKEAWGKNKFNATFPAALCCYLESKNLAANYLSIGNDGEFTVATLPIESVFGLSTRNEDVFFAFESAHTPYQRHVIGNIPRTDLVLQKASDGSCVRGLEVKLTALPDHVTCELAEDKYGSEIVVRPDTIVYLACSFIETMGVSALRNLLNENRVHLSDWTNPSQAIQNIQVISEAIGLLAVESPQTQIPFLLQPVWKTRGKSPELHQHCLDVFVWSNSAFCHFIAQNCNDDVNASGISRHTRSAIWLYKMLFDFCENGQFDHHKIIDELSYNTKNDKAFASSGAVTNRYMASANLTKPRITKDEIKNIILGGGQNLLSPERRFDAIIYNSPDLFEG